MSRLVSRPGVALGFYPERDYVQPGSVHRLVDRIVGSLSLFLFPASRSFKRALPGIALHSQRFLEMEDHEIQSLTGELRRHFRRQAGSDSQVTVAFALIKEIVRRKLDISMSDEQMLAGWIMHRGDLAEMADGEGRSLAIVLPACIAALSGIPVHVICASDSLAATNAKILGPVYEAMGISVGLVARKTVASERRGLYQRDVTYCSSRQVAFDYLQDLVTRRQQRGKLRLEIDRLSEQDALSEKLRLRGLCYAIVDNADAILGDESLRPLALSRSTSTSNSEAAGASSIIARTTFPRFFQRYINLCGVGALLRQQSSGLHAVYGLRVQRVGSHSSIQEPPVTTMICRDKTDKREALCERVLELTRLHHPVFVATRNIEESGDLCRIFAAEGIACKQIDRDKGDISYLLSDVCSIDAVTVSSAWSGHGMDIDPNQRRRDLDGLHIIFSERASVRAEKRFINVCAARGSPASITAMSSLEDAAAQIFLPGWLRAHLYSRIPVAAIMLRVARHRQQRFNDRAALRALSADLKQDELLAFSGPAL